MMEIFTVCFFGVVGLGVFMFFLWGIVSEICTYKQNKQVIDTKYASNSRGAK